MKTRRIAIYVPLALCVVGALTFVFRGCRKAPEKPVEPPANAPAVYMNDPAFRKALEEKRNTLQMIVNQRAPLVKRMEELVKEHGEDLAALQNVPEWNALHKRIVALNAKYEEVRASQLAITRERLAPQEKEISK